MTQYEHLEQLAHSHGVLINLLILQEDDPLDGYYISMPDGCSVVLINRHRDLAHRTAALAEELGHHFRSVGDLRSLASVENRKSELAGHAWGIDALLPLPELETQLQNGNGTAWELAEACDLPPEFIEEAASFRLKRQPRLVSAKRLPEEAQQLIRKRAWPSIPPAPPAPVPPPKPRVSVDDIRPLAWLRAVNLLGYRPKPAEWRAISFAFRTEIVYSNPERVYAQRFRKKNSEKMSEFIRIIYAECFENSSGPA